jgi:hypothetical protein
VHPATEALLAFFEYEHLPSHLQVIAKRFHALAHEMTDEAALEGAEVTAGLRKLLEAKDCFVRAAL